VVELEFRDVAVFVEGGKPEIPEKNPPNKARTNNKLNPHMAPGRNRNRATLVRGERSLTTAPSLLPSMLLTVEIFFFSRL